jgi:hypothetical protein
MKRRDGLRRQSTGSCASGAATPLATITAPYGSTQAVTKWFMALNYLCNVVADDRRSLN